MVLLRCKIVLFQRTSATYVAWARTTEGNVYGLGDGDTSVLTRTVTGSNAARTVTLTFKKSCKGYFFYGTTNVSGTCTRTTLTPAYSAQPPRTSFTATANQTLIFYSDGWGYFDVFLGE